MQILLHFGFLGLIVVCKVFSTPSCSTEKNFSKNKEETSCINLGLSILPLPDIPENTAILILSSNNFKSLSTSSFKSFKDLTELDASDNGMTSFEIDLPLMLEELNLANNTLKTLPMVSQLPELTILQLSNNHISTIPQNTFVGLKKLTRLELQHNYIDLLDEEVFESLRSLKHLDLSYNQLLHVPDRLLSGVEDLEIFYLSSNRLTEIPENFFEGLELNYVYLEKNPWNCNCALEYFKKWLEEDEDRVYEISKDGPTKNPKSVVCSVGTPLIDYDLDHCRGKGDVDINSAPIHTKSLVTIRANTPLPTTKLLPTEKPTTELRFTKWWPRLTPTEVGSDLLLITEATTKLRATTPTTEATTTLRTTPTTEATTTLRTTTPTTEATTTLRTTTSTTEAATTLRTTTPTTEKTTTLRTTPTTQATTTLRTTTPTTEATTMLRTTTPTTEATTTLRTTASTTEAATMLRTTTPTTEATTTSRAATPTTEATTTLRATTPTTEATTTLKSTSTSESLKSSPRTTVRSTTTPYPITWMIATTKVEITTEAPSSQALFVVGTTDITSKEPTSEDRVKVSTMSLTKEPTEIPVNTMLPARSPQPAAVGMDWLVMVIYQHCCLLHVIIYGLCIFLLLVGITITMVCLLWIHCCNQDFLQWPPGIRLIRYSIRAPMSDEDILLVTNGAIESHFRDQSLGGVTKMLVLESDPRQQEIRYTSAIL